jgi:signal transduction histidine kinase
VLYEHSLSHGLVLMRDRLSLIDCQMEIESMPGKGTRVVIRIPDGIHHTAA